MILEFIIDLLTTIGQIIIKIVNVAVPKSTLELGTTMAIYTTRIISICTQANNFLHFMLGDFVVVLATFSITLLVFKYTIYPIISFIRSIFVNGNT